MLDDTFMTFDPIYHTIVGAGLVLLGKTLQVSVVNLFTSTSSGPLLIVNPFV